MPGAPAGNTWEPALTRVNCVDPISLSNVHLIAEIHELPRVFTYALKCHAKGIDTKTLKAPKRWTLGPGHVKFHAVHLGYTIKRYRAVLKEAKSRGINVRPVATSHLRRMLPNSWFKTYYPTEEDLHVNRMRIEGRTFAAQARKQKRKPTEADAPVLNPYLRGRACGIIYETITEACPLNGGQGAEARLALAIDAALRRHNYLTIKACGS